MTMHFADIARTAAADGAIAPDELQALRRAGWASGDISPDEAEAIFAINAAVSEADAAWSDFFVEAIREYVVNGTEPRGHVSPDNAEWLIHRIEQDGQVRSMTELELLVRVLEKAENAPQVLKDRVLHHVEQAVRSGSGPTRAGGTLEPGRVTAADVQILRRTIFAGGGNGPAAVSREEAELLFRLKDGCLDAANAPEWKTLFVQGVANYLQGASSPVAQLSRERAAQLEEFMQHDSPHVGRFFGRMAAATPNAFGVVFGRKAAPRDRFAELSEAREITAEENAWLQAEIAENGMVDEYDQALLRFLAEG